MKCPILPPAPMTTNPLLRKNTHTILLKMQNNIINMNAALNDTLVSLIPTAFKLIYEQEPMMNPNAVFRQ